MGVATGCGCKEAYVKEGDLPLKKSYYLAALLLYMHC